MKEEQVRIASLHQKTIPLLLKIAPDLTDQEIAEIAEALQAHVIDALAGKSVVGVSNISPTVVLQALYFLTEQCFIQWDAPP